MQNANRQIRLIARPDGLAGPEHFDETTEPVRQPDTGEVLVETLLLSIDPGHARLDERGPGICAADPAWVCHARRRHRPRSREPDRWPGAGRSGPRGGLAGRPTQRFLAKACTSWT